MKNYLIMTSSTSYMLSGNEILKKNNINTVLVPAPKEYGSVCAIAIRIDELSMDNAMQILQNNNIPVSGIFEDRYEKLENIVKKLKNSHISTEFNKIAKKV